MVSSNRLLVVAVPFNPSYPAFMDNGTPAEDDTAYKMAREEVRVDADKVRARAQKHRARIERWAAWTQVRSGHFLLAVCPLVFSLVMFSTHFCQIWTQNFDIMDEAYRKNNGDPLPGAKMLVHSKE